MWKLDQIKMLAREETELKRKGMAKIVPVLSLKYPTYTKEQLTELRRSNDYLAWCARLAGSDSNTSTDEADNGHSPDERRLQKENKHSGSQKATGRIESGTSGNNEPGSQEVTNEYEKPTEEPRLTSDDVNEFGWQCLL
jgi:hypothetical protein